MSQSLRIKPLRRTPIAFGVLTKSPARRRAAGGLGAPRARQPGDPPRHRASSSGASTPEQTMAGGEGPGELRQPRPCSRGRPRTAGSRSSTPSGWRRRCRTPGWSGSPTRRPSSRSTSPSALAAAITRLRARAGCRASGLTAPPQKLRIGLTGLRFAPCQQGESRAPTGRRQLSSLPTTTRSSAARSSCCSRASRRSRSSPRPATRESAARYAKGHRPDVLILDINMPGGSGLAGDPDDPRAVARHAR